MFHLQGIAMPALRRPSPGLIRQGLEVALVGLLALQAGRLFWALAEPAAPLWTPSTATAARPAQRIDLTILERFDPFFRSQPTSLADGGQAGGGGELHLFGLRSDGRGGGSAIMGGADGAQRSFALGDDVGGGAILSAIGPDHVVLKRGASRVRVDFASPSAGGGAPSAPAPTFTASPASAPAAAGLDPRQFLASAALTPQTADGRVVGYRVLARGGGQALAQAGLQDGDLITAIDGSPLGPERVSELPALLANAREVEVRFERGGQQMTTRLGAARQ